MTELEHKFIRTVQRVPVMQVLGLQADGNPTNDTTVRILPNPALARVGAGPSHDAVLVSYIIEALMWWDRAYGNSHGWEFSVKQAASLEGAAFCGTDWTLYYKYAYKQSELKFTGDTLIEVCMKAIIACVEISMVHGEL